MTRRIALVLPLAVVLLASPVLARAGMGGGMGPGWGPEPFGRDRLLDRTSRAEDREGKVEVTRFVAEGTAADALGHGPVLVRAAPASEGDVSLAERERAVFEAAVIDRLAGAGYQTADLSAAGGQVAELRVVHDVVVPEEAPHKPVSGEMTMGVSNRGSMVGMAIAVDLTKPRKALVGTRLEVRLRDRATQAVLWEGHADIATREGSERWTDQAIATRLAEALFDKFPGRNGETLALK